MKTESNTGISRRSFLKRSTVAAIAASNLMMFTGLVNASKVSPSPDDDKSNMKKCNVQKVEGDLEFPNGTKVKVWECVADLSCDKIIECGKFYEIGDDGNPKGGPGDTKPVTWKCSESTELVDPETGIVTTSAKIYTCLREK